MPKIVRVGVTFPPDLLKDFDDIIAKMGYESRSKAIQDAVRAFISEYKWLKEETGSRAGVIMILYDHEVRGLEEMLTDIQHDFHDIICSTLHVHLTKRDCLEAIAVRGEARKIRKLAENLASKRGVKLLKLMLVSP
ncbi:MAG TPA: nickel-responsive transcriptional regulator NikR [Candidatus Bathyarchaeota archaeon]|nr:nickel-responsive transcriptional regulator NikR [Candidatus Bathyarchaeota archaeon]